MSVHLEVLDEDMITSYFFFSAALVIITLTSAFSVAVKTSERGGAIC